MSLDAARTLSHTRAALLRRKSEDTMSVYKREWITPKGRKGSAWYWKFQLNGEESHSRARNPDNPKQKARTKAEAEVFEAKAIQRMACSEPIFKPKQKFWTFAEFVKEIYEPTAKRNLRSYHNGPATYLNVLLPVFGDKRIDLISPFEIEQFKYAQKGRERTHRVGDQVKKLGRPIKNKTVNLYLDCLAGIFSMAVAEKLRPDNPVDSVVRLEEDAQINKRILTHDQEARLLKACDDGWRGDHLAAAIVCLVEGGFRPQEFFEMAKSQVDLLNQTVTVISYKTGRKRRKSSSPKERIVPISDRALPYYQKLMATDGEKLFPFGSVKKGWATKTASVGLSGFWLRWLRDTAKQRWEAAGLGPFEIAYLLGNSVQVITKHYNALFQARARELMNSVAKTSQKEKREVIETSLVSSLSQAR